MCRFTRFQDYGSGLEDQYLGFRVRDEGSRYKLDLVITLGAPECTKWSARATIAA